MADYETKLDGGRLDVKSVDDKGSFSAYLATFNNEDQGHDTILPGAFDATLSEHKSEGTTPKLLWQHNPSQPIGVWKDLTLDSIGLKATGQLILGIPLADQTHALLKAGALDSTSIGYRTRDFARKDNGGRYLKDVELVEASVVTFPMNKQAKVSDVKNLGSIRDVERALRDAGVPNAFAKLVASHGYDEAKAILEDQQRDAEDDEENEEKAQSLLKSLQSLKGQING